MHSYVPKDGYVPNEGATKAIAEAVLFPAYGKANITTQKPYKTLLVEDFWVIEGTLKPKYAGGISLVHISKASGSILLMTHGK